MHEHLTGLSVTNGKMNFNLCLSFNVFTFGVEVYEGSFLIRIGPIAIGLEW